MTYRRGLLGLLMAAGLFVTLAVTASTASAATAPAQQPGHPTACAAPTAGGVHRAGLVVTFAPGNSRSFCVEFTEDAISGIELLERAGVEFVSGAQGGLGDAVCSIEGTGCNDPGDCFCRCRGGTCEYWSYYKREGGTWRYQNIGPSTRRLRDGDVDGWAWGPGSVTGGTQPAAPGAGLCAEDAPTPLPLPTATVARPQTTQGRPGGGSSPPPTAPAGAAPGAAETSEGPTPRAAQTAMLAAGTPTPTETPSSDVQGRSVDGRTTVARASDSDAGNGSGSALPLVLFGVVGMGLAGATGYVWYRRSHVDG